jgi:rhodanese-related sulfurtransferase
MKKILAVLAVAAFAVSALAGEYADVSVKEVKTLVASKKAVLIDVNGTKSYNEGRVPGALNYEAVKDKLASALPADKSTLIVPIAAARSARLTKKPPKQRPNSVTPT